MLTNVNLRPSNDPDFWGDRYPRSVYLWEGFSRPIEEVRRSLIPVMDDLFRTKEQIREADVFLKGLYFKLLPELARRLNQIHGLSESDSFWECTLGVWFFRHVSIVYDKYAYFSKIDFSSVSVKLLDEESFYIPTAHYQYLYCFSGDHGVQQLLSLYCALKGHHFPKVKKKFSYKDEFVIPTLSAVAKAKKFAKHCISFVRRQNTRGKVVLCNVFYTADVIQELRTRSEGRVYCIDLPQVQEDIPFDFQKRRKLAHTESNDELVRYIFSTLEHCLPTSLLEHFPELYGRYNRELSKKNFKYVVSEVWMSDFPTSIYLALARKHGRYLIFQQHGASLHWLFANLMWMEYRFADLFMTTGWKDGDPKTVAGGFSCRDITEYSFASSKQKVLFITRTKFPFLQQFGENPTNSCFAKLLESTSKFLDSLPEPLKRDFYFRPRVLSQFVDVGAVLELERRGIQVDKGDFSQSIAESKIVIVDHLSTGIAEILKAGVPCLIVNDPELSPLADEYEHVFDDLIQCGVFHTSLDSARAKLLTIQNDVFSWWMDPSVQSPVRALIESTLGEKDRTVDYIISLLQARNTH